MTESTASHDHQSPKPKRPSPGVVAAVVCCILAVVAVAAYDRSSVGPLGASGDAHDERDCNVMGISIRGLMLTYDDPIAAADEAEATGDVVTASDAVYDDIQLAEEAPGIEAILVEVDSGGGSPYAGAEIADALKRAKKPVVAYIRQSGMSAAYWAATGADRIFASKNSDVGSIGVTSSYVDESETIVREGRTYVPLSSGKYKDSGDPAKPLTAEEKALIMRDVEILHGNFVDEVAANRGLERAKVAAIADGSSVLGARALELGLIDELGGLPEAEEWLSGKIGKTPEICW